MFFTIAYQPIKKTNVHKNTKHDTLQKSKLQEMKRYTYDV